jgi:hypothetical protein
MNKHHLTSAALDYCYLMKESWKRYYIEYLKITAPKEMQHSKKAMLAWLRMTTDIPLTLEDI